MASPPAQPVPGATRADVARHAGVSAAVVSYVLNGGPRPVAPGTRDRVLHAVDELAYRPNAVARALRLRKTHTFGLLVPDISNPYFAELAKALEDEAFARGYALLLANSSDNPAREAAQLRTLIDRQVDGLIVISSSPNPDLSTAIAAAVPLILLDRAGADGPYPTVVVDNRGGAHTAVDHLIEHGRRRIACISGPQELPAAAERHAGWHDATTHHRPSANLSLQVPFTRQDGFLAAHQLLTQRPRPDALLACSDLQGIGALHACYQLGLTVPNDIAIIAFDGTQESEYTDPPLTVIRQPTTAIAADAITKILTSRADTPPTHTVHNYELVLRRSCGCATSRKGQ